MDWRIGSRCPRIGQRWKQWRGSALLVRVSAITYHHPSPHNADERGAQWRECRTAPVIDKGESLDYSGLKAVVWALQHTITTFSMRRCSFCISNKQQQKQKVIICILRSLYNLLHKMAFHFDNTSLQSSLHLDLFVEKGKTQMFPVCENFRNKVLPPISDHLQFLQDKSIRTHSSIHISFSI